MVGKNNLKIKEMNQIFQSLLVINDGITIVYSKTSGIWLLFYNTDTAIDVNSQCFSAVEVYSIHELFFEIDFKEETNYCPCKV